MRYPIVVVPSPERVTLLQANSWARGDYASLVNHNPGYSIEQYVNSNGWAYWLASNCWYHLTVDVADIAFAEQLYSYAVSVGLRSAITWFASYADCYVRDNCTPGDHVKGIISRPEEFGLSHAMSQLPPKSVLQICRFLKRFSLKVPAKHSLLHDQAIAGFIAEQKRLKDNVVPHLCEIGEGNCSTRIRCIVATARYLIKELIGEWDGKVEEDTMPLLGPGAARNCGRRPIDKLEYLFRLREYTPQITPRGVLFLDEHPDRVVRLRRGAKRRYNANLDRDFGGLGVFPQVCRMSSVPKKVDSERLIAPEDPANMARQLRVMTRLDQRIKVHRWGSMLPLHDQSANCKLAQLGALTGIWATYDFSAASDTVTKKLCSILYPSSWYREFMRCMPTGFILSEHDAGPRFLYSMGTMGCGCTFIIEAITFWAITAATYLYAVSRRENKSILAVLPLLDLCRLRVYGDDVIAPGWFWQLYVETVTELGLRINDKKSFWSGPFRESCGSDWLMLDDNCVNVTSVYWPRIPMGGSVDSFCKSVFRDFNVSADKDSLRTGLESLISLQHRLHDISPSASAYLTAFVRSYAPYITTSTERSNDVHDLYGSVDTGETVYFVGGHVPVAYRRTEYGGVAPDGYVLASCMQRAIADLGTHIVSRLLRQRRVLHVAPATRVVASPADTFSLPMAQAVLYDLALQPTQFTGGPQVWNGVRGSTTDLNAVLRIASPRPGLAGIAGEATYAVRLY